jgi:hypothetical protein
LLIALPLAFGVVGALVWRRGGGDRTVALVGGLALLVRLLAAFVIYQISLQAHDTGEWLNDESAFFKATQSLMPYPLDRALPGGLEHLGGDGFLGLTTALSLAGGGVVDANAIRVANAGLGAAVVVISMLVSRRLFGHRAALAAGLLLAVWPTLVLWSATILRDTMLSLALVSVWWALGRVRTRFVVGAVFLSLVIVLSLRPYAGIALAVGVLAWAIYPRLTGMRFGMRALIGLVVVAAGLAVATQTSLLIRATNELFYRQTVSRLETLSRLYVDQPDPRPNAPFRPGEAVARVESGGWLLGGVVQQVEGPDKFRVAYSDASVDEIGAADLVVLRNVNVPPLEPLLAVIPNVIRYLDGSSTPAESDNPAWIVVALAWDLLALVAVVAAVRERVSLRPWLLPITLVGATILALSAVPGAPGNADRHRAAQTMPFVVVLASGLLAVRRMQAGAQTEFAPEADDDAALSGASANSRNQSSSISSPQI